MYPEHFGEQTRPRDPVVCSLAAGYPQTMKPELMEFLVCPLCHAEMTLTIGTETGGEIIDGSLKCTKCAEKYPIEDGIPNLLPPDMRQ